MPTSFTVNVKDYGAAGNGVTDDTAAFAAALAAIESRAVLNPAASVTGGSQRGRAILYVPEGAYLITRQEALMRGSYPGKTAGFAIQGAGRGITQIIYNNPQPNQYLLNNNDAWLWLHISDIEFTSANGQGNFMHSVSNGAAQNYVFERCVWNGLWNYVFHLEGTNLNSEMTWIHCNFNGTIRKGVYVPAATGSDQFLNYNFHACQFEVESGDYLHFEKGGSINVWGGSIIHTGPDGGTFFRLSNGPHAGGVERFLCVGARFEHRSQKSKLIDLHWNDGAVAFINCDMGAQAFAVAPYITGTFTSENQKMSSIKFDSCILMGKHEYVYKINSFVAPHNVIYENCEFMQAQDSSQFIVYTNQSGSNFAGGGIPIVKFRNCRGISDTQTKQFLDADYGHNVNNRAQVTKKIVSIRTLSGQLPANGAFEDITLPLGAVVTNIKFASPAGAVASTAPARYTVQSAEPAPTVLAAINQPNASKGFYQSTDLFFICDTEQRRTLRLTAGNETNQNNSKGYCLIEYI
jgi:hypothetical protein